MLFLPVEVPLYSGLSIACCRCEENDMSDVRKGTKLPQMILLLIPVIMWSSNFVVGKIVLRHMTPLYMTTLRFFVATGGLLILMLKKDAFRKLSLRETGLFLVLGNCGIGLYNALIYIALEYTSSINASLIKAVNPAVTVLLTAAVFHKRLKGREVLSVALSVLGATIVALNGSGVDKESFGIGALFVLASVVLWSVYNVVSKLVSDRFSALEVTFWSCLFGLLSIAPFGIREGIMHAATIPASCYLWILYLGLGMTTVGMLIWQRGLRAVGTVPAALVYNLIPVFTVVMAKVFLQEAMTPHSIIGGILIVVSTFL